MGPWLSLGGAVVAMGIGRGSDALDVHPSAGLAYYATFSLFALTLLQFTGSGALVVDRRRLLDLVVLTCAALLLVWVFAVGCAGLTVSAPDAPGDAVLAIIATRLLIMTGRSGSALLLTVGATGVLVGDLAHHQVSEAGHVVFFLALGAAALHPSMTRLTRMGAYRPPPWDNGWTALLCLAVATPPTVLLVQALNGAITDGVIVAVVAGCALILTITRLSHLLDGQSQALNRERCLREASTGLVAAADVPDVEHAVRAAVARLLADDEHRLILTTDDRPAARPADPPTGAVTPPRSWWQHGDLGDADEATLVCPLWPGPPAVARNRGRALMVTGRHDRLAATRDALELLAGQAALALDRIAPAATAGPLDIGLHLQAMLQTSSDVILVVDVEQRIQYASPAMNALLGTTLGPLQTLQDLVIPDDRGSVTRALLADDSSGGVLFCALQRSRGGQVLVEAGYRDLRDDPLVQGFALSFRNLTDWSAAGDQTPFRDHVDHLPAQINRRSARDKFRY
jgi:PAS domain-containing protein